jgi:hypothetical protein
MPGSIEGVIRDPTLVCLRVLGRLPIGVDPQDDLAQKLSPRCPQPRAGLLPFGSAGTQRLDPLGMAQRLPHATGHHTERALCHKRCAYFPPCHRPPCPSFTGSLLLARGTKLPKHSSTLEGVASKALNIRSLETAHGHAPTLHMAVTLRGFAQKVCR